MSGKDANEELISFTSYQILFGLSNEDVCDGQCMWHTGFWLGNLKETNV